MLGKLDESILGAKMPLSIESARADFASAETLHPASPRAPFPAWQIPRCA